MIIVIILWTAVMHIDYADVEELQENFNMQVKKEELLTSTELEYFASSLVVGQVSRWH